MKKCPYCGHENADGITICEHCYAGFPQNAENNETKVAEESKESSRATRKKARS